MADKAEQQTALCFAGVILFLCTSGHFLHALLLMSHRLKCALLDRNPFRTAHFVAIRTAD